MARRSRGELRRLDDHQGLLREIDEAISGDVVGDSLTRHLYSTDASNYRVVPLGVVFPRSADDVSATISVAAEHRVPVIPRGSGTSVAGQALGSGLVLDFTRSMNAIQRVDVERRTVRAEPGTALGVINHLLEPANLMVGPDPVSAPVATLGGMIGNNSTGPHSVRYGMTSDHARSLSVVMSDGSQTTLEPKAHRDTVELAERPGLEGSLYKQVPRILERYADSIQWSYPATWRNVAGYGLDRVLANYRATGMLDLAALIVGSEGTLAVVTSVELGLVDRPAHSRLVLAGGDLVRCLQAVPELVELEPLAVELIDGLLLDMAARQGMPVEEFTERIPQAMLWIEVDGRSAEDAEVSARGALEALRRSGIDEEMRVINSPQRVARAWEFRQRLGGLLSRRPGEVKLVNLVDDPAVPLEHLAAFAIDVRQTAAELGVDVYLSGHVSAGCLHVNPAINLKSDVGLAQVERFSKNVTAAAIRYGGTSTGEHGEGFARSYFNSDVYGEELNKAFVEIKALFDPKGTLNPGKIVNPAEPWDRKLLRYSPNYSLPLEIKPSRLDFTEYGGVGGLIEMCTGQALCRSLGPGVMCPSYRATRAEENSTRGRANALRALMAGDLLDDPASAIALDEAMDLCLGCRACKSECPAGVDMAKIKIEYLALRNSRDGVPLHRRLFGHTPELLALASRAPRVANRLINARSVRGILEVTTGLDRRRQFPSIANRSLRRQISSKASGTRAAPDVLLWDDTFVSYSEPEIGVAAHTLLLAIGLTPQLLGERLCCGRPAIAQGLLDKARGLAERNLRRLLPFARRGIPIVGLEPSCVVAIRDDYPDLLRSDHAAEVASAVHHIDEFLIRPDIAPRLAEKLDPAHHAEAILFHGHCHQASTSGLGSLLKLMNLIPNAEIADTEAGCCGMAGAFGYETEHYELSIKIAEERLIPAVDRAGREAVLAASGASCRHQIRELTGRSVYHPVQLVETAMRK